MWQDALRVCKEYIPHKLSALQDEYEREMMDKSTRGAETLIQQVPSCFLCYNEKNICLFLSTLKSECSGICFFLIT